MTATAVIDGDNVIITFTYSPLIVKGQNIIDLVSRSLTTDLDNWDNLTNQEKLDMLDDEIKRNFRQLADSQRLILTKDIIDDQYPIDL